MGMAASQARLIALNARMSDIEYQGQQINQQRTTLSSQINELYNSLLDMDVPTPPSTLDFQKTVYSGITGATKFKLSNVIPTGKNPAGRDTYSVDLAYQMTGHAVTPAALSVNITQASEFLYFNNASQDLYMTNPSPRFEEPTASLSALPAGVGGNPGDNDVVVKMKALTCLNYINGGTISNNATIYTDDSPNGLKIISNDELSTLNPTASVYVTLNPEDIFSSTALGTFCNVQGVDSDYDGNWDVDSDGNYVTNPYDPSDVSPRYVFEGHLTETNPVYEGYQPDLIITLNNLYAVDTNGEGGSHRITSQEALISFINAGYSICQVAPGPDGCDITIDNPDYNPDANGTGLTVGNMPVYNMDDSTVIAMLSQASYDDYIEALRHSFPAFDSVNIASYFYVYIEFLSSGQLKPHFILKSDVSQLNQNMMSAKVYDYDEDGTYTSVTKTPDCELEFDASTGRIARLGIPDGNGQIMWIKLTTATEVDQQAYDVAFNNYEYEKAEYDKEQQLINAKTSIIQAEDKSLQLKLTRLDNERNAVNTEIDAVKKVIQDNIEDSFKTFSG